MNLRLYLVAYDIASPRRRRQIVSALRRVGERIQLSVFLCRMTTARGNRLERELLKLVEPETDRIMLLDLGPASMATKVLTGTGMGAPPFQHGTLVI